MIEEIISLLVTSKKIPDDVARINSCLYSLSGAFSNEKPEFDLKMTAFVNVVVASSHATCSDTSGSIRSGLSQT